MVTVDNYIQLMWFVFTALCLCLGVGVAYLALVS